MEPNLDNEKLWTMEGLKRYIRTREKRWVHEDTKRDAFREWQSTQVSGAELVRLRVNWTRSDKARIKYRVDARKKSEERLDYIIDLFIKLFPDEPCPCKCIKSCNCTKGIKSCECAKESTETAKRRKKEDTLKARKREAQDLRIEKKRRQQDADVSSDRAEQDKEIAAHRKKEDNDRDERDKEHAPTRGTNC